MIKDRTPHCIVKPSFVPKYHQLAEIIRNQVRSGELQQGAKIPTEKELQATYGLSSTTVVKALNILAQEGILYREAGRGSFVARARIDQPLNRIMGFTDDMLSRGMKPGNVVLRTDVVPPSTEVKTKLLLSDEDKVFRISRVRLADGKPMALQTSYFPYRLCPGIEKENLNGSLIVLLRDRYGLTLVRAEQTMWPVLADRRQAKLLGIPVGAPVQMAERISYLSDNRPIDFLEAVWRGDRYRFVVQIGA